jgi:HprK-related kinase A
LRVSELTEQAIFDLLRKGELLIRMHPFTVRVRSDIYSLASDISRMYADFSLVDETAFSDFHVEISYEPGVRRWLKPLARFYFDGRPSFIPLPAYQAFPMFEWGVNWCIAAHAHQYLVIHAAVIERQGCAIVLPAPPGSGKSTLCAALVNRGWRLLSDELALYDMDSGLVFGMARPINLKNRSIPLIKDYSSNVVFTSSVPDTSKGTVALMKPPEGSVDQAMTPVRPSYIVLPRYLAGADSSLQPYSKARTFMLIVEQSFNYHIQGMAGFQAVGQLLEGCSCLEFTYSSLEDAERIFSGFPNGLINT